MTKKRILLYKSFLVLLTYLLLELSCVVAIRAGYIPARLPSFEFVFRSSSYPMVFADINPTFGSIPEFCQYEFQLLKLRRLVIIIIGKRCRARGLICLIPEPNIINNVVPAGEGPQEAADDR